MKYLDGLNDKQKQAVLHSTGPALILAGAGTGKTKVLTHRAAYLIHDKHAQAYQILAVTFTNKAAKEMKNRIGCLIDTTAADSIWLGTFHSIAARILRTHAELLGFTSNFTILDVEEQIRLAKQVLRDFNLDEKKHPAKLMIYIISRYKDRAWTPDKVPLSEVGVFASGMITTLYSEYQSRLKSLTAMDFGDLLLYNIKLFNTDLAICTHYQNKFKYIMVDEYQDINVAQYLWLKLLAQVHRNIYCVGDDDQSIYGWRGAEVQNILRFDKDFPDALVISLEQNYRSTTHILNAATAVISNNKMRHGKKLWTQDNTGTPIKLSNFYDEKQEARFIADEIDVMHRLGKIALSQTAVLVRASHQTRVLEESMNFLRIPYRITGGMKFYERMEIKDIISYIRLLVNPEDSLAFERVINTPKRGIGNTTLREIQCIAKECSCSLFKAANIFISMNKGRKSKAVTALMILLANLERWKKLVEQRKHVEVVQLLLDESGYNEMLRLQDTEESKERLDNLKELIHSLDDFSSLTEYLEHVSLVTDADQLADDNKVNIMTIHAAKGLEFDLVFLPGWEEGIFPSSRALTADDENAIEEERRLAYVAITRAKHTLHISYAASRRVFGTYKSSVISRFIEELPVGSCDLINSIIAVR